MYTAIYTIITDRLRELGFENVGTGFGRTPPLPAVQVWLGEDKLIEAQPVEWRDQLWVVQLTIAHDEVTGRAQQKAHDLVNTLRAGFYRWKPQDTRGFGGPFSVDQLKIEDYKEGGSIVYLAALSVRVYPGKFV